MSSGRPVISRKGNYFKDARSLLVIAESISKDQEIPSDEKKVVIGKLNETSVLLNTLATSIFL